MKKIIALLLAMMTVFSLCACGNGSKGDSGENVSYVMLDDSVSTEQYGIGFKVGNDELRDAVQAALYKLFADGKVGEVANNYSDYSLDKMICLDSANATEFDAENASAEFKARKTFTVGFDAEYPPYGYMDENGEYTGFDLELAQLVCDIYNWELVKKPIDWDTKDVTLNSGAIDCIWNGFTMTGRESEYCWSDAYVDNSIVVLTVSDRGIKSLDDLAGKVVSTQAGSSALTALEEDNADLTASFKELQQVADYNTAMMNLDSGIVDAVVIDIGVAQYYLSNQG